MEWMSAVIVGATIAANAVTNAAVKKADKRYQSFGGIKKGAEGSVKFVIETDAIETEDE